MNLSRERMSWLLAWGVLMVWLLLWPESSYWTGELDPESGMPAYDPATGRPFAVTGHMRINSHPMQVINWGAVILQAAAATVVALVGFAIEPVNRVLAKSPEPMPQPKEMT
jgi:hypothetical protein